ncbi:MAG: ATP-dependent zinc metalloprotease FtsH [Clostridiales bacterium]|nr:ATP-dependent zinc metalloprotease FtsH [Clostridiales bacterium]
MKNMAKNWKSMLIYILIPILLIVAVIFFANQQTKVDMKYSQVVAMFENDEISEFSIDLSSGSLTYKTFSDPKTEQTYSVPSVSYFLEDIRDDVSEYNAENPDNQIVYDYIAGSSNTWIVSMLPSLIMFVLIIGLGIYAFRKMSGAMNNETNRTLGFGKIRTKSLVDDEKRTTTFKDVAGCDEEKAELEELVDFLKSPDEFTKLGARIPKGVLLIGPPGTGKTLLARAVAGEAGVPFLSISGSDFVEMYVGVGASRVRDLFDQAKKKSPAIIFIDEIDAVGRHRGAGMGGGHDEREQTLNQLLVEMDGFGANEGVIIIAATNRPDILDPALLRPGRFDRQVTVGRPDTKGREEILKVHSRNKPLAPDVDLKDVAKGTIGFVGADLENLMNEAALLAARKKYKAITSVEIQEAMLKVIMGTEKKSHKMSKQEVKLTAYHEAGHAVATYYLETQDDVHEISIIPRGMAGGYTMSLPSEDKSYQSKLEMLDELVVLLGGRVAEALTMGDISTGASNDIERASKIAREMITKYGMSDTLGPITYGSGNDEVFIGRDYGHVRDYSEDTAARIDDEVSRLINDAYKRTEEILKNHMDKLELVAINLMEKEKIDKTEFNNLMEKGTLTDDESQDSDDTEDSTDSTTQNDTDDNSDVAENVDSDSIEGQNITSDNDENE